MLEVISHTPCHEELKSLNTYPFFRRVRKIPIKDHIPILINSLEKKMETSIVSIKKEKQLINALTCITPEPWESGFFDIRMGRLELFFSEKETHENIKEIVAQAILQAKKEKISYLIAEVDIDDYATLQGLTQNGFDILDQKKIYFSTHLKEKIKTKFLGNIRNYREHDLEESLKIFQSSKFESRHNRDPHLNQEAARKMKESWFIRLLKTSEPETIKKVFIKNEAIVACTAGERMKIEGGSTNLSFYFGGLYAGNKESTGAYHPMIYSLAKESLAKDGLVATVISANNDAPQRTLESMQSFSVTSRYVLRKILPT